MGMNIVGKMGNFLDTYQVMGLTTKHIMTDILERKNIAHIAIALKHF